MKHFSFLLFHLWIGLTGCLVAYNSAQAADQAAPHLQLELIHPLGGDLRGTRQLALSPDDQRVARMTDDDVELWQLQPPQMKPLFKIVGQMPRAGNSPVSIAFDPTGRLHFISNHSYVWLDPDLSQGGVIKNIKEISPDGRYALRYGTVGFQSDELEPQYNGASDDIYDLHQHRSVCQLPITPSPRRDPPSSRFSHQWFATQLGAKGPTALQPLVMCNLSSGQVLAISLHDKLVDMAPSIDPQGHFMQLRISGQSFLRGTWVEYKTYALPLSPTEFKTSQNHGYSGLPYGSPTPMGPPESEIPWSDIVSPDGHWWVVLSPKSGQMEFFRREGRAARKVATWPLPVINPQDFDKPRVVFSRNSRWVGLQFAQQLYLVDLQADKLEFVPVHADIKAMFKLQAIADNGTDWLLMSNSLGSSITGVWRLKR